METKQQKPDLCKIFQTDLLTVLEVADLLDIRASDVRHRLANDPASLPEPLRFQGGQLLRWPRQQIAAWYLADCPRAFSHGPAEFVPRLIYESSDNYKNPSRA